MESKNFRKKKLLTASIAGLLVLSGTLAASQVVHAEEIGCYGVNACKGQGECRRKRVFVLW